MVIGYNPSHSNINSEVNAPFKIISTLLRFIDNESKQVGNRGLLPVNDMDPYDNENGPNTGQNIGTFKNYQMKRENIISGNSGERLDTMEGYNDLYDDEDDTGLREEMQNELGDDNDSDDNGLLDSDGNDTESN
jgi:hypothetical protein